MRIEEGSLISFPDSPCLFGPKGEADFVCERAACEDNSLVARSSCGPTLVVNRLSPITLLLGPNSLSARYELPKSGVCEPQPTASLVPNIDTATDLAD
jgi:hypothetical protein